MRKVIIFAGLMAILLVPVVAAAVEKAPRITDREIVERLTRLEEGQKALNKRFDDVNRRIDDLRAEMNGRINDHIYDSLTSCSAHVLLLFTP
jgi:hypothetical protein